MNKTLKIYLWSWLIVAVLAVILFASARKGVLSPYYLGLTQNPSYIEKITHLDLPEIMSVDSYDNLYYCSYYQDLLVQRFNFAEKLSDNCIHQLETLCLTNHTDWHKYETDGCYNYDCTFGDIYFICYIYEDYALVGCYIDEIDVIVTKLGFYALLLVVFILIVMGIAILFRIKKQHKQLDND